MPSFSTRRGTYKYYYQPYINPVEIQKPVFFCSLIIIVFVIAVITSSQFIPHYIHIQYPVWFVESGFYWIDDILISIAHCLPPLFIVIMLINCHVPHDILDKIIQKHSSHKLLVFHLSTFLTILVILSSTTTYFKYKWSNIYLIKSNSILCKYFEHNALNLWDTWFYLIHRAILPLILYAIYLIYYCKIQNQSARNNKPIHNELEMSLIQNDSHNKHENNHFQITASYTITSCVIYLSLYAITIFVIHFQFAVSVELLNNRFELIYIIFNIWLKLLKFISKRAARLCDQLRSQKSMHDHYICLEYLTEWIFDVIYWNFVRYYIVFKAPSLLQYFFALSVHFSMEMLQTNMRYTSIFLKVSNYLSLLTVTDIDPNYKVWRTRLSMDFMLRFYASLLCTLMTIIQFVAYGKDWFEDQLGSDNYYKAVIYTLVSGITELLHYTLTVVIAQKLYKFNIITPFVSYVSMTNNKHRIALLLLYGTLFVMLFGSFHKNVLML